MFKKAGVIALCLAVSAGALAGCSKKQTDIDAGLFDATVQRAAITEPAEPIIIEDTVYIAVAEDAEDIKFDFAKFFEEYPEFIGKNFYFTRDDVKKGDGTFVKGFAWVEVEGTSQRTRRYKKLGSETDEKIKSMGRSEIAKLIGRTGETRMYFMKNGERIVYLDHTTGSAIAGGKTQVTFRLHGNHGKVAIMNLVVTKPGDQPMTDDGPTQAEKLEPAD
jgi:hypothetical protein